MRRSLRRSLPQHTTEGRALQPYAFSLIELPPRPHRLPRGPRRIRDGLWSQAGYSFDDRGHELMAKTHADGHSIVWPVLRPDTAALVDPDGNVLDTLAAWREAHAFAVHWGAP